MTVYSVLIVDDSALVRQVLTEIINSDPQLNVIGTAGDPYIARDKIKQLNPDVLTLDIEMPKMDGITFLGNLMRLRPMPVVMVSTLTEKGADVTLQALELGAVDYVEKPKLDVRAGLDQYSEELLSKIKTAALSKVKPLERKSKSAVARPTLKPATRSVSFSTTDRVIGIGSSTGGTEAIKDVLRDLPPDIPGIVISQHIPVAFSKPFADRVNNETALAVSQAVDGQQIFPGHVYIAPGDQHLQVKRDGAHYRIQLNDGEPVNRHKPSVEVMFDSLADQVGKNAIAIMLTGMGADGAEAMGRMKATGAPTICQDEKSSVVWGMPGAAAKAGYADQILSLKKIPQGLLDLLAD